MSKCLNCKEIEVADSRGIVEFKGCTMFCSKECRDIWNDNHPQETIFLDKPRIDTNKYCPKCNRLMNEKYVDYTLKYYCKKCEEK